MTAVRDRFFEYLTPTMARSADEELVAVAAAMRSARRNARRALERSIGWVHDPCRTRRGPRACRPPAIEVLACRRGVCQDFVHLGMALLRAVGIPARYASGYLYPWTTARIGETVRRREPRVARGVDRRVAALRPDQRPTSPSATCSWPAAATTPTSPR